MLGDCLCFLSRGETGTKRSPHTVLAAAAPPAQCVSPQMPVSSSGDFTKEPWRSNLNRPKDLITVCSDGPAQTHRPNRETYARAFARLAEFTKGAPHPEYCCTTHGRRTPNYSCVSWISRPRCGHPEYRRSVVHRVILLVQMRNSRIARRNPLEWAGSRRRPPEDATDRDCFGLDDAVLPWIVGGGAWAREGNGAGGGFWWLLARHCRAPGHAVRPAGGAHRRIAGEFPDGRVLGAMAGPEPRRIAAEVPAALEQIPRSVRYLRSIGGQEQ